MEPTALQKEVHALAEDDPKTRKKVLLRLYSALVLAEPPVTPSIAQALLPTLVKPLLRRLADKSEKCRELSAHILKA